MAGSGRDTESEKALVQTRAHFFKGWLLATIPTTWALQESPAPWHFLDVYVCGECLSVLGHKRGFTWSGALVGHGNLVSSLSCVHFALWPLSLLFPPAGAPDPRSQHAGQLPIARQYARATLRRPRRSPVTSLGAGRRREGGASAAASQRAWVETAARASLLFVRLRRAAASQSGPRRQDGVASDAGNRERGRTRTARAHRWSDGRISGAGAGGEPELPLPTSSQ